jgi:transposase
MVDKTTTDWLEWRRIQALNLSERGWRQRDIAAALGVTDSAVSHWLARARRDGPKALKPRARSGRPAKLTPKQKQLIPDLLWHGPEAYGFPGPEWSYSRVAAMMQQEFHVAYSKSQVSRLLKDLGWTPRVELGRVIPPDEMALRQWRAEVWPDLRRRARRDRATIVLADEFDLGLSSGIFRNGVDRILPPALRELQARERLSVIGAVTPTGGVEAIVRHQHLDAMHVFGFLGHLLRVIGKRLIIVWDRSPLHRGPMIDDFLTRGIAKTVHIERLPPYAPGLNPVGWMRDYLKRKLCKPAIPDLEELHLQLHVALADLRRRRDMVRSFYAKAGLSA